MAVKQTATLPGSPTGDFKGDIKVDNRPPTEKETTQAGEVTVFDKDKKPYKFSQLLASPDAQKHTYLVVFIRHFFCGNCQEYTRVLSNMLPPSSLPANTSVIIIGCGNPVLINQYLDFTGSAYPIYADPSKQLYKRLRMIRTLDLGQVMPRYMSHTSIKRLALRSVWQELSAGRRMLSGGDFWQVGGEFVFEADASGIEATWCHRMKNTRDHAELDAVKAALGMLGDGSDSEDTIAVQKRQQQGTNKKRWSSLSRRLSLSGPKTMEGAANMPQRRQSTKLRKRSTWTPSDGTTAVKPSSPAGQEAAQERQVLEQLKEEGPTEPAADGSNEDALAKLTGGASEKNEEATTPTEAEVAPIAADKQDTNVQTATAPSDSAQQASTVPLPALTDYQKEGADLSTQAPSTDLPTQPAPVATGA